MSLAIGFLRQIGALKRAQLRVRYPRRIADNQYRFSQVPQDGAPVQGKKVGAENLNRRLDIFRSNARLQHIEMALIDINADKSLRAGKSLCCREQECALTTGRLNYGARDYPKFADDLNDKRSKRIRCLKVAEFPRFRWLP